MLGGQELVEEDGVVKLDQEENGIGLKSQVSIFKESESMKGTVLDIEVYGEAVSRNP